MYTVILTGQADVWLVDLAIASDLYDLYSDLYAIDS